MGLLPLIQKFLKYGLIRECESKYNTPILPIKKSDRKTYRMVQDLRAINRIVQDIHPVVANPYTLLTTLTDKQGWFTVLDLKDAFFCIPMAPESQDLFAFEWENPETGRLSTPGLCSHKDLRTARRFLETSSLKNLRFGD